MKTMSLWRQKKERERKLIADGKCRLCEKLRGKFAYNCDECQRKLVRENSKRYCTACGVALFVTAVAAS